MKSVFKRLVPESRYAINIPSSEYILVILAGQTRNNQRYISK